MKRLISLAAAIIISLSSAAVALDKTALVGTWQLVERAKDSEGKPCPFVGDKIQFTADGKMVSANMPMPFSYKANPGKAEIDAAIARNPELKGMEILLATMGEGQVDWTKARIVYGVKLKDNKLTMIVSGYSPSLYKKIK